MSEEEILTKYIELINKGYCCACNELNCIDNFPQKKIANAISNLQQENTELKKRYNNMFECHCNRVQVERLQNNWNELKKWLEEKDNNGYEKVYVEDLLYKMQELENNND